MAQVPAPQRGEAVRAWSPKSCADNKDALGSLVALEMGKIKAEGDGEVQEMIDIADFAVGQSRMLYGKTMHSERPQHSMYEQWHPLGITGIISAFNFPVAVWAWNAFIAAICGNISIWKPSPKTPLTAIAVQNICNRVLEDLGCPPIFQLIVEDGNELAKPLVDDPRVRPDVFHRLLRGRASTSVSGSPRAWAKPSRTGWQQRAYRGRAFANLDLAVPAIVFGAVGTAGQRCTTTRRVLVHSIR